MSTLFLYFLSPSPKQSCSSTLKSPFKAVFAASSVYRFSIRGIRDAGNIRCLFATQDGFMKHVNKRLQSNVWPRCCYKMKLKTLVTQCRRLVARCWVIWTRTGMDGHQQNRAYAWHRAGKTSIYSRPSKIIKTLTTAFIAHQLRLM